MPCPRTAALVLLASPMLAGAELPSPLSRFGNLPCLAPLIRAVDPEAPKNIGEALLLPPYRPFSEDLEGIGVTEFVLSDVAPPIQSAFDQGIALLHGFDDIGAERCFRAVASGAPEHPMPYLGLALANERHPGRAKVYANYAQYLAGRSTTLSDRERGWISLYHTFFNSPDLTGVEPRRQRVKALEDLAFAHPDDLEARAFLLRELTLDEHRAGIAIGSHFAVDALAESIFAKRPQHPAANYRTILWLRDRPQRSALLAAAAPTAAPRSPGAWRSAAEAFAASGRYHAAIFAQRKALQLDLANQRADFAMPDEHPDSVAAAAAHIETLISCGAITEASELARRLISMPRTAYLGAKHDTLDRAKAGAFMTGRRALASALMRGGRWAELQRECKAGGALSATESWADRAHSLYWRAIAEWHLQQSEAARATGAELEALFREFLSAGTTLAVEEELKTAIKSLRAYAALLTNPKPSPAPKQSLLHVSDLQLAQLLAERGSVAEAITLTGAFLTQHPGHPEAVATHCTLLAESGSVDDALPLFDMGFRRNASLADKDHPLFGGGIAPVVKRMRLRGNWTLRPDAETLAALPEVESPADAWRPPAAPDFELPRPEGGQTSLADLSGSPNILIFFVGVGCPYCVEQLKVFQPHAASFSAAGIPIQTVSTDSVEALQTTLAAASRAGPDAPPAFPFPILADPSRETFSAYRCFDSYNNKALHGVYLISPEGKILWTNISHEPFLHPEFLLREAKRLLAQSS